MSLFDTEGFGKSIPQKENLNNQALDTDKDFKENSFDKTVVDDISPLVKMDVINKNYNMGELLRHLGYDINGSNMYCPFHPDSLTGKPSAKYHSDSDKLYCFSENKIYTSYHVLKLLYDADIESIFRNLWVKMSISERKNLSEKYESIGKFKDDICVSPVWDKYSKLVLSKFRDGSVNYKQYKNALYKILVLISKERGE